jgi:hypothetical protein
LALSSKTGHVQEFMDFFDEEELERDSSELLPSNFRIRKRMYPEVTCFTSGRNSPRSP